MRDYQMRTTTLLMLGKDIWGQMWQRMNIDPHSAVMQNTQQIVSVEYIKSAMFKHRLNNAMHCAVQCYFVQLVLCRNGRSSCALSWAQPKPTLQLTTYFYYAYSSHKNIKRYAGVGYNTCGNCTGCA